MYIYRLSLSLLNSVKVLSMGSVDLCSPISNFEFPSGGGLKASGRVLAFSRVLRE